MAINACSINAFTINGRQCRTNIAALITRLHPPAIGGNARAERYTPYVEREERPTLVYEQPIVSVTVEILGFIGTDTQDVTATSADIVVLTNLELGGEQPSVNITDITFE